MPATTTPAARLLNLVIALMNTPVRMTKDEIRRSVAGYDETASPDAFERMFERDKDSLRDLGVPIVTVELGGHATETGYRIDKDSYALDEVDLTPAELGVLSLAAQFWQDAAVAVDTSRALTKLRSAGEMGTAAGEDMDAIAGLAPRVLSVAAAYEPLLDAIVARRVVTFTYRAASTGEVRRRTVEPWKVAVRDGGWYLLGHDRDRDAARAFRLTRVEGAVKARGSAGAFTIPTDLDVDQLVGRGSSAPLEQAVLALRPESASALRARGSAVPEQDRAVTEAADPPWLAASRRVPGREIFAVPYSAEDALAGELAGYGDAVLVLAPLSLRAAVLDRLRAAADLTLAGPAASSPTSSTSTSGEHRG